MNGPCCSRHPEFGDIVSGVFRPVLVKDSNGCNLIYAIFCGARNAFNFISSRCSAE